MIRSIMESQHGGWSSLCGSRRCTCFVTAQRLKAERTWLAPALTCKICPSDARPPGRPQLLKVPQFSKEYCQLGTKCSNMSSLEILHIQTITDVEYCEHVLLFCICSWPILLIIMEVVVLMSKDCCEQ